MVHRELLDSSRKAWTYWLRALTTLAATSVLLVIGITHGNHLGQNEGFGLFVPLAVILFLIVSVTGLRSTAGCISRERREGTLGLLFLTDLKLPTILLSKLLSHSIQNVWALLAVVPVMSVCVLLGGVSGRLFLQTVLAVLAALALSLAIGLQKSCSKEDDHLAFSAGLREVFLFNLVPLFSPLSLIIISFWDGTWPVLYFWFTFAVVLFFCWVYWARALGELARNWQGEVAHAHHPSIRLALHQHPQQMGHFKKPSKRCGVSAPALWIISRYGDFRQASPKGIAWVFTGALLFLAGLLISTKVSDYFPPMYLVMMGGGRCVQLVAMAKIAPQSFAEVTAEGALEILQTTPVHLRELIHAARRFLSSEYIKGLIPMVAFDGVMVGIVLLSTRLSPQKQENFLITLFLQNCLFFAALPAVGLTGIWLGIRHGNFARAAFRTTCLAVILPLCAFFFAEFREASFYLTLFYAALAFYMAQRLRTIMGGGEPLMKLLYGRS